MKEAFENLRCLVIGTGVSGRGAAKLLLSIGAVVILFDENENVDTDSIRASFGKDERIRVIKGNLPYEVKNSIDLVVLSPGVPLSNPLVRYFDEKDTEIIGEVELAFCCGKGDVLAITGTNGKTTTTTLLGEIMKNHAEKEGKGRKVFVVGNIGDPYTLYANEMDDDTITVAEISSFQLETIKAFKPRVSAVLNITPDHLNRHHTMENYAAVKKRITENQDENDIIVLNLDDPYTVKMAEGQKGKVVYFTRDAVAASKCTGDVVFLRDKDIFYNDQKIISTDETKLLGSHNYENIMAAIAMAVNYGVDKEVIIDTVRNFKAVEHRIEFVENVNGVDYFNDSKGTNPDASIKAVEAMIRPTILIGGGYDKKSSFDELIDSFDGKVKLLVLIGETAELIRDTAFKKGFDKVLMASDLKEAVRLCHDNAESGDAVLLSPACASWDQFKNYEERGNLFKEYVRAL